MTTTLGRWLTGQGFLVDDGDVPLGRESEWHGVDWVLVHHTVSDDDGPESSIASYVRHGGSGTYPPLAQIMLGQSGTVWMCSQERSGQSDPGRASHAGSGQGYGVPVDGMNAYSLGIECQCDGSHKLATHATLYKTLIRLCAALCRRYGLPASHVIGHKEWSTTGKVDPRDDMDTIRADVAAALGQPAPGGPHVTEHVYRSKCGYGEPTNGDTSSDTVKELQERLNRITLAGGQELAVTGRYDADTDEEVRLWQEQIAHDPPDPSLASFLGPHQFALMFPDSIYTLHDDGDPAIAHAPTEPEEPNVPDTPGVTNGFGLWDWYSGKRDSEVRVHPDGDWHKVDLPAQPASGITTDSTEHHFLYLRIGLPSSRSATRTIETKFVRSDGDATAYWSPAWDAGARDSIAYYNSHLEAGSGLGGQWWIKVSGGSDPITYSTRYAKTHLHYVDPAETAQAAALGAYDLAADAGRRLLANLLGRRAS